MSSGHSNEDRTYPANGGNRTEYRIVEGGDPCADKCCLPTLDVGMRVEYADEHVSGMRGEIVDVKHEYLLRLDGPDDARLWISERNPAVSVGLLPADAGTPLPTRALGTEVHDG